MNADYAELTERLTPVATAAFYEHLSGPPPPARALGAGDPQEGAGGRALRAAGGDLRVPLPHGLRRSRCFRYWRLCAHPRRAGRAAPRRRRHGRRRARARPRPRARARGAAAARGDRRARRLLGAAAREARPAPGFAARSTPRSATAWRASSTGSWQPRRRSPSPSVRCSALPRGDDLRRRGAPARARPRRATATSARRSTSPRTRSCRAALVHAHYTFRKRLSHTADSQDQRHRMTPASRPILAAQVDGEPDVVAPALVARDEECGRFFTESCARAWAGMARLAKLGVPTKPRTTCCPTRSPSASPSRRTSCNLHHKHTMRLCYNAQEEIWRASTRRGAADPPRSTPGSAVPAARRAASAPSPAPGPSAPRATATAACRSGKASSPTSRATSRPTGSRRAGLLPLVQARKRRRREATAP